GRFSSRSSWRSTDAVNECEATWEGLTWAGWAVAAEPCAHKAFRPTPQTGQPWAPTKGTSGTTRASCVWRCTGWKQPSRAATSWRRASCGRTSLRVCLDVDGFAHDLCVHV